MGEEKQNSLLLLIPGLSIEYISRPSIFPTITYKCEL